MSKMNEVEKLHLQKMIKANDAQDNTESIRTLKHSDTIRNDVAKLLQLKKDYSRLAKSNPVQFDAMCVSRCGFLFDNYTDIFNKVKKDEIDLNILHNLLTVLKMIEEGELDQHEGSFEVGKLLKQIYVDSALKKAEHLDEEHKKRTDAAKPPRPATEKVSWSEYKKKIAATSAAGTE